MASISSFAIAALAGVVSAVGSVVQGSQQAALARYNQGLARQNAEIATQQAAEDAERSRRDTRRRIGAIEAAYGDSGLATGLDVIDDAEIEGELDALTIEYRGSLERRRYLSEATEQGYRARVAMQAGYAGAAGALLSSAGRIGERWDFGARPAGGLSARIGGSAPVSTRNAFS